MSLVYVVHVAERIDALDALVLNRCIERSEEALHYRERVVGIVSSSAHILLF
jgi:hypothetical protein